jgi:hypothetical protein
MKKILLSLFAAAILFGCNSQDSATTVEDSSKQEHAVATHDTDVHEHALPADATALTTGVPSLNNGAKWKADASTNENVANLKSIIDQFKTNANPEVKDYQTFQAKFTDGISKMVTECKMKGADHDALHVWLEPLMKENKEMKDLDKKESLAGSFHTISQRVDLYPQYFE